MSEDLSQPSTSPPHASELTAFSASLTGTSRTRHSRNTSETEEKTNKDSIVSFAPLPLLPPLPVSLEVLRDALNGWYDRTIGFNSPIMNHEDREAKEEQFRTCIQWAFPDTSDDDMREHLSAIYSFQASQQEDRVYGYFRSITRVSSYAISPVIKPTQLNNPAEAVADDSSDVTDSSDATDVVADDSSDATEIQLVPVQLAEELARHLRMTASIEILSETMKTMNMIPKDIKALLIAECHGLSSDIETVHTDTKETLSLVQSLKEETRHMTTEMLKMTAEIHRVGAEMLRVGGEVTRLTNSLTKATDALKLVQMESKAAAKEAEDAKRVHEQTLEELRATMASNKEEAANDVKKGLALVRSVPQRGHRQGRP